jgi:glycosyltransferase involved in cell wall biosynthesis
VHFVGQRPPTELRALYHAARVHACVSWYETPGLASLEAALCGCNIVVAPGGCTREYFGDAAHYCEPDDPRSIQAAVEAALAAEPDFDLAVRVAREFNWDAAARNTLRGYELALGTSRT